MKNNNDGFDALTCGHSCDVDINNDAIATIYIGKLITVVVVVLKDALKNYQQVHRSYGRV